ncbi:MAG: F0F1 ATP synthase subunit delta [Mycoplasmataceae bacterium]|nr:F0F1 ATP synthase subunit delta [Mycoplasmataceae bacterium]
MENKFVINYAKVILEKINTKKLEYYKKISDFIYKLEKVEKLRSFLFNESIDFEKKEEIIDELLNKWQLESLKEEIKIILILHRSEYFFLILKNVLKLLGDEIMIERIKIFTAFKMSKKEIEIILKNLKKQTKKEYTCIQIIDKKLIGGFVIKTRDFVYNNSVKYKLDLINQKSGITNEE